MFSSNSKYALVVAGFVLCSPLQPVNAATLNAISISYFPLIPQAGELQDNWKLDTKQTRSTLGLDPSGAAIDDFFGEYNFTLSQVRDRVNQIQVGAKNALEEGSRYRGYKNPSATKSIEYNFLNNLEILEAVPLSDRTYNGNPLPDYLGMMNQQNICNYVDNQGVKEVWLYSYGGVGKAGWESNFSSKYGDFSNSDRVTFDLPSCQNSYTVYDYNYGRGVSEAVHNHMHQFEAIFGQVDSSIFQKFTGFKNLFGIPEPTEEVITTGVRRCGNTHFPPNAVQDYDWYNPIPVASDCEDWHPNGTGQVKDISSITWEGNDLKYFIYWMQNVPGLNNGLTNCSPQDPNCVANQRLKNWWTFINDFDNAYQDPTFWENIPTSPQPPTTVPEPSTLAFLGAGIAAMIGLRRKNQASK